MKEFEIKNLEQNIAAIRNYLNEIECIEKFLEKQNLINSEEDKVLFWNHFVSLFQRVDNNEMDSLEIELNSEATEETLIIVKLLLEELKKIRKFDITEFEEFLIILYIQKLVNKRSAKNE